MRSRLRPTLVGLALALAAPLVASLLLAAGVPQGVAARFALALGSWALPSLLLGYLFLPGFDLPWRVVRRARRSSSGAPALALTFDDGPHPETTPAILAALARAGVRATFFLVGNAAERWPELVERIAGAGHAIGNHTQRHRLLPFRTAGQLTDEIADCQRALAAIAGLTLTGRVRLFRPPHGFKPLGLHRILDEHGLRLVAWHGSIRDTDAPGPDVIVRRALRLAGSGRILLLHDNPSTRGQTAAALPAIIAGCRARGYELVTLD